MLTTEDIQKLSEVLATKEDIKDLKSDMNALRELVQALTLSVDKLVKAVETLNQEYTIIKNDIERHERWFKLVANKLGIDLER